MLDDIDPAILNARVRFGLRDQGHLPTVSRMLAEGKSWQGIGAAIGWEPATAKRHWELANLKAVADTVK